ncbi:MAG: M6 family metalloprotease domain-containing protein [Bacteroidaceae bacterium]|nr:M6 family metalloprotease domain-containing protein [Bacteroidaceae bacterium]
MKRIFTFLLLAALTAASAMAVRPLPRYFVKTQSDGTQIVVQRCGDGHNGVVFYTTQDDIVLVQNAGGDLCYAVPSGTRLVASSLVAHEATNRSAEELAFINTRALGAEAATGVVATRTRRAPVNRISSGSSSRNDGLGVYGQTAGGAVPSQGEFTMPVIMVEFSDVKFQATTTQELLTRQYNETGFSENGSVGSVRDYFISQSGGMFRPRYDVAAKVTLSRTRKYYGKDNSDDDIDPNLDKFQNDALEAAVAAGVDFSKYVYQGGVPCVILLYAGEGEANSYDENSSDFLWPCEWDEDADFTLGGKTVHINSFFVGNEIQYDWGYDSKRNIVRYGDAKLEGIGTFCHEFGHALGLPDFYCTDYSHSNTPLGYWDIMDMGSYLNDGYAPIGHTAYERNFLGWLNLRELTEAEHVTLRPFGSTEGDHAVLIRNDKDSKEYYIFENRQAGTWYPEDMAGGMLGLHVAFDKSSWTQNTLNNTSSKLRMQVFAADGAVETYSADDPDFLSDLFPGSKNKTQALNTGTPAMKAYTGTYMNKPLYRIAVEGENITFNFLQEELSNLSVGDTFEQDGVAYEVTKAGEVYVTARDGAGYTGQAAIPASVVYDEATWKVVGIRAGAFSGNEELTAVSVGANVADIEEGAFRNTPALTAITVDAANGIYESNEGALFTKRSGAAAGAAHTVNLDFANNVLGLPVSDSGDQSAGNFTGPATLEGVTLTATDGTSTATRMWEAKTGITLRIYNGATLTLAVPDGATMSAIVFTTSSNNFTLKNPTSGTLSGKTWTGEAQSVTFSVDGGSTFLTNISVTVDGLDVALPWSLLKAPQAVSGTFNVPDGVSAIAAFAFENCAFDCVMLPATLTTLGEEALSSASLTSLAAAGETPAECLADPFTHTSKSACTLAVPAEAIDAYKAATYWREFFNIVALTTGINTPLYAPAAGQAVYDLQGRRVAAPARGVYIVGGRKVVF